MTDQEKFEQWITKTFYNASLIIEYNQDAKEYIYEGWKAAKQDSAAEIAELKEIIEKNKSTYFAMENLIEQLQAHDDEVIERCAVVAEGQVFADDAAKDIRELKGE